MVPFLIQSNKWNVENLIHMFMILVSLLRPRIDHLIHKSALLWSFFVHLE